MLCGAGMKKMNLEVLNAQWWVLKAGISISNALSTW